MIGAGNPKMIRKLLIVNVFLKIRAKWMPRNSLSKWAKSFHGLFQKPRLSR